MTDAERDGKVLTLRLLATRVAILAATTSVAACAGSAGTGRSSWVVARVGVTPITQATLQHWMRTMAPHHIVPRPPGDAALRRQALSFLISSQWLIGEAAAEGMRVSARAVGRRLAEKERSFPNGKGEFKAFLQTIAHTVADQELEIRAELASERIRRRLIAAEHKITSAEVAGYYRQNVAQYHVAEERYFDIVENLPSAAFARTAMKEVRAGKSLRSMGLYEWMPRVSYSNYSGEKRTIYEAIFKARPHVLTGPIRLGRFYFLIEVTRITPAYVQSYERVRDTIFNKLNAEQQQRTLAASIATWRSRWTAKTDCYPGYVVQKCRQYTGVRTPEDSLQFN